VEVYRLTHKRYAEDLSGFGAYKTGGRWNPRGYYALYLAQHPCGAILEMLIHLSPQIVPDNYCLVSYELSDTLEIKTIKESMMPKGWRKGIYDLSLMQEFGKKHLFDKSIVGIRILSAVAYPSFNLVLNPLHNDFKYAVKIKKIEKYIFDPRLVMLIKN
jgi:RES domain-containing protein